ncbi:MAG: HAMP domain-containing sensor histidine kinase [Telluria sp.]
MRLSNFIRDNMEVILQEWEDFAITLHPLADSTKKKLRDHAQQMLLVICIDLDTYQCEQDSIEKSKGNAAPDSDDTAAEAHAEDRAESGFTIEELMAEYRAMRASVLRLWQQREAGADALAVQDMLRFNEAIDQSLTESVARYSEVTRDSQNVFLAILGHDVRNPLGAIGMGAQVLSRDAQLPANSRAIAERIWRSTQRVNEIVSDLLDFSSSSLGGGMPIKPELFNFEPECKMIVEELQAFHPDRTINLAVSGNLDVVWDRARVNQALSNLVANAIHHGDKTAPIWVTVAGGTEVSMEIRNMGAIADRSRLATLFDPGKRFNMQPAATRDNDGSEHLGLGLYITRDIVNAHGGRIDVASTQAQGTTFRVTLPRDANAAEKP